LFRHAADARPISAAAKSFKISLRENGWESFKLAEKLGQGAGVALARESLLL